MCWEALFSCRFPAYVVKGQHRVDGGRDTKLVWTVYSHPDGYINQEEHFGSTGVKMAQICFSAIFGLSCSYIKISTSDGTISSIAPGRNRLTCQSLKQRLPGTHSFNSSTLQLFLTFHHFLPSNSHPRQLSSTRSSPTCVWERQLIKMHSKPREASGYRPIQIGKATGNLLLQCLSLSSRTHFLVPKQKLVEQNPKLKASFPKIHVSHFVLSEHF